ncbi:MAG: prepilin-type N-terminal cleavage/methylation domain-containing protein [Clostridia bacterium]|nr:prepilin-type N-terminal cleavage/methylation domain-containing protein [Clostridia bacterium]
MKRLGNKGTTLIELLTAVTILCIITAPLLLVLFSGYNSYYMENDRMLAQKMGRELMEMIMRDIRMNEGENGNSMVEDSGNTLRISDTLIYTYHSLQKKILKNEEAVLSENQNVQVLSFHAEETKPDGYDSFLVSVSLKVKVGRSEEVSLSSSYRRKSKS